MLDERGHAAPTACSSRQQDGETIDLDVVICEESPSANGCHSNGDEHKSARTVLCSTGCGPMTPTMTPMNDNGHKSDFAAFLHDAGVVPMSSQEFEAVTFATTPHPWHIDFRAVWSVTSMSLGAGVFTIPACFLKLGLVYGCIWVIFYGFLADFAMQRLLDVASAHGASSYEALADRAFGKCGTVIISGLTMVTTFIACLAYMGTAKELFKTVFVGFLLNVDVNTLPSTVNVSIFGKGHEHKDVALLMMQLLAVVPFCMGHTMGAAAGISKMGVMCIVGSSIFFTIYSTVLLTNGCGGNALCGDSAPLVTTSVTELLENSATLAFSYSMIFAVFPVLQERVLDGDVPHAVAHMKPIVRASVVICCVCYLVIGLLGCLALGTETKPFALNNLALAGQSWSGLTQFVTLMVAVMATLLFAVISFPTLHTIENILSLRLSNAQVRNAHPYVVIALALLVVIVDTFLPTKIAFALCASLGLATAAYILPCLLFLYLGGGEQARGTRWYSPKNICCLFVILFGCVLLFGATPATLISLLGTNQVVSETVDLADILCHPTHSSTLIEAL